MSFLAVGAAFVDRSGAVVAVDRGFLEWLGASAGDASGSLRARAAAYPVLAALLAGEGGGRARVLGSDGADVEVERIPSAPGALLVLRTERAGIWIEEAMRSLGACALANGVAHEVKNRLNAMALQLALIGEKLGPSAGPAGAAAVPLGAIREQIARANEVLGRFLAVSDPAAPFGHTDLGSLLEDAGVLFGHECRRRRVTLAVDAQPGGARTSADPSRAARLALGLFSRALAETPDGGRLVVRAEEVHRRAVVVLEHTPGDPGPDSSWGSQALREAAAALGGELAQERGDDRVRLSLALPGIGGG